MIKCENACPLGRFNACCQCCPENKGCPEACEYEPGSCGESAFDEESGLVAFPENSACHPECYCFPDRPQKGD